MAVLKGKFSPPSLYRVIHIDKNDLLYSKNLG